jgi:hypothetical protein
MQKKVEYIHQRLKIEGRETQKPINHSVKTAAAVREFKSRAQLIQEKILKNEENSKIWFEEF